MISVMKDRPLVRALTPDDVPLMRELLALFGRAFDDVESYSAHQPDDGYLEKLLNSETFIAITALREGRRSAGLRGTFSLSSNRPVGVLIYDLAVDEPYRREGVATAIVEKLKEIAASRGIYAIFVQADLDDEPAIALYTALGNREDVLHFDIAPRKSAG